VDPEPPEPVLTPEQGKLLAILTGERLRRFARERRPDLAWYDEDWDVPGGPPCGLAT
jgi:hypothetical protein